MKEVIVSTSKIYAQIAKYSGNPNRQKELSILVNALQEKHNKRTPLFVKMSKSDVELCFGMYD